MSPKQRLALTCISMRLETANLHELTVHTRARTCAATKDVLARAQQYNAPKLVAVRILPCRSAYQPQTSAFLFYDSDADMTEALKAFRAADHHAERARPPAAAAAPATPAPAPSPPPPLPSFPPQPPQLQTQQPPLPQPPLPPPLPPPLQPQPPRQPPPPAPAPRPSAQMKIQAVAPVVSHAVCPITPPKRAGPISSPTSPPPADLVGVIQSMARLAAFSGPGFEERTLREQDQNKYQFLLPDNEYHAYYCWQRDLAVQKRAERLGGRVPAGSGVPAASSSRPPPEKRRKFDAFGTPRSSKAALGSRVNV